MAECIKNQGTKKHFFAADKKHAKKSKDLMKIIKLEFTEKYTAKLTGKHLCRSLFNKVACLRPVTLFKKIQHRCFSVNFAKFLRTPILQNIC